MFKKILMLFVAAFCAFPICGADQALPGKTYVQLAVNGVNYYYSEGVFYQYSTNGYVIVKSPAGAVVPALPAGYTPVNINGKNYYCCLNTYYVTAAGGGYMVSASPFEKPSVAAPNVSAPAAAPATTTAQPITVVRTAPVMVRAVPPPVTDPDSQNPIRKLGRGIVNVALGVFEIPININDIAMKEGPPQAMSYGLLKGVGFFIMRELVGAVDAATFLFPLPGTKYSGSSGWGYGPVYSS